MTRFLMSVGVFMCALLPVTGTAQAPAQAPPAPPCQPSGDMRYVCDQSGPEDFAILPGAKWVIGSSQSGRGALRLLSVQESTSTDLFPAPSSKVRADTKTYKSCPGPFDAAGLKAFKSHGLYLVPGKGSVHKLFVVAHGTRESIEVFDVETSGKQPTVTWIGCAVAPDPVSLNSVVALPDGGFVTTNFIGRGAAQAAGMAKARAGENAGEVWEWHPASGWVIVPGSEDAGPNGLEMSKDGKWLYVGAWGRKSVVRLSRGVTPVKKDAVVVGFNVDNVRWAPDGSLFAAGATDKVSYVSKVNPKTLTVEPVLRYPDSDVFRLATTAVQIGKELWLGSVFGDRIPRVPVGWQPSTR